MVRLHIMSNNATVQRRELLAALSSVGTIGLCGCSFGQNSIKNDSRASDRTSVTTSSSQDNTPPTIVSYTVQPKDAGTRLRVQLKGRDNEELEFAKISYGSESISRELESKTVEITDELVVTTQTDVEGTGDVSYLLRDTAGNETKTSINVDRQPPSLNVNPSTPLVRGEVNIGIETSDNIGLGQLVISINGGGKQTLDMTGRSTSSIHRSLTPNQHTAIEPGRMNTIETVVSDTFGNSARKTSDQYVRKYDVPEETRLSLGTVYQPYFGFKNKVAKQCRDERIPTIGRYERPLPFEVFNRHIDQMTGHGINRVMIEFLGNETGKHDKRFLEADLIDDIQIEPFYTAAPNLWDKGYWSTVESYRDDLVRPHMAFMREHILSRDNVTTLNGRPVIQMWNSVTWAHDYQYNRIVEEWGGYESFFDEIRSLLSVNGTEPFFVGGTNWWGHGGYPDGRKAELTKHFDATTTWMVGAELHDGFTSQETALEWVEENWRGHREFTDRHDMDFVPMVFPGFNEQTPDAGNCDPRDNSGEGRRVPRSPSFFKKMLDLAEEYRTTKLVNNSVYNNWQEGTHIEPGVFEPGPFDDNNYGTAYLDVIAEFQRP